MDKLKQINRKQVQKAVGSLYKKYMSSGPHMWLIMNNEDPLDLTGLSKDEVDHRRCGALTALSELSNQLKL